MSTDNPFSALIRTLPVNLFGSIMSMTRLSFAWRIVARYWAAFHYVADVFAGMAIIGFLLLAAGYLLKWKNHAAQVKAEVDHPVAVNFFATIIISVLLIPGIVLPLSPAVALGIWSVGVVSIFLFAWYVLRRLMNGSQDPANATPAWFLPIVGTLDVPIVGSKLPFAGVHEVCLFFFAIGIGFTIVFFSILFARTFFLAELPDALKPSLVIFIGPLALAFSGYIGLFGQVDMVAHVFYYFNLFLLLLIVSRRPLRPPFRMSWWAVGFPLAAFTIASINFSIVKANYLFYAIAGVLLIGTTGIVLYLLFKTLRRVAAGAWEPAL